MTKARPQLKTKALSAALTAFFISSHAFSVSQINSEFEMLLPRQFQQILIDKKWESLINKEFQGNWQFPDQETVSQEVPVKIRNISLKIKSHLHKPALDNDKELLQLNAKNLQAQINIGEVSVDHIVERVVGGIIGRFRIQASCKNVILSLNPGKGTFGMVISPTVESSNAGMALQSFNLSWLPNSWVPENLQCEGAAGFTDIIKNEISKMTEDSTKFIEPQRDLIKNYLQSALQKVRLDFSQPKQLIVSRPDIQVVMKIYEFKDLEKNGASLKGTFQIDFLKAQDNQVKTLTLTDASNENSVTKATLRLPKDFIKEITAATHAANAWLYRTSSDKLPGFTALMNSRFNQTFVWPDLKNYSPTTKFLFDIYSNKDVSVEGEAFSYQLKATFNSLMKAPRSGTYIPYMNFTIPLTSKIQVKVENQKVFATFANPYMGLSYKWDSSYVKKYYPSQKFAADTIRDKIVGGLWGKTMSFAIPKIPLTQEISFKVLNATVPKDKQDVLFQLAP